LAEQAAAGCWLASYALRLRDTEEAHARMVADIFDAAGIRSDGRAPLANDITVAARRAFADAAAAHRALDNARRELQLWQEVRRQARAAAAGLADGA
jgi:hypothetical protein